MGSNNGQIDLSKWAVKVQAIKTPRCGAASTKLGQRSGSADAIPRGRCNIVATACKRHYRVLEEGGNPEGRREVKWKRHKQCNAIAVGRVKFAVVGAAALPFGGVSQHALRSSWRGKIRGGLEERLLSEVRVTGLRLRHARVTASAEKIENLFCLFEG